MVSLLAIRFGLEKFISLHFVLFLQVPVTFAVGKPLDVEKNLSPSPEQVDAVHGRFCEALVDVFDQWKAEYGWGDKKLELR